MSYKLSELIEKNGEPIFVCSFVSDYTEEQRIFEDIPEKVAVFETDRISVGIIIYGLLRGDEWIPNYGSRALIKKLIERNPK